MCGIAGMVRRDNLPIDGRELLAMTDRMRHRGPDGGGTRVIAGPPGSGLCAGLGHRRLSIIDLSPLGRQPMANEDGTVWVTFNGEIYNYKTLRVDLVERGHTFRSESDTEVIIHGYEEYGEKICAKLNGMYAFGIWDGKRGRLVLCRDRFGKKPLYYRQSGEGLEFASELKSFLEMASFKPELDIKSLALYLAYEYVPVPHSIYKGVYKLPPATYLCYNGRESSITPYWDPAFHNGQSGGMRPGDVRQTLLELLKKAVEKRLMSDVPLGAFLSGGVDSSAVVALMSEIVDSRMIKTFSIGFADPSFDESRFARTIAVAFNTDHHEKIFTAADLFSTLPTVWDFLDEPFADASILPTYMLSKFTRESVTVALGGDGGDELFAGYDPFPAHRLANWYTALVPPWFSRTAISPLVNMMPVSSRNMSLDFRMKQFLKGVFLPLSVRNQVWLGAFPADTHTHLLSRDVQETLGEFDAYQDVRALREGRSFRDWVDEITYMYQRFYLGEDILTKVDRASMAVSLEVRTPFLDLDFAEFANGLPSTFKLHGLTRKYILKKALEKKLPGEIIRRKKKGFGIPLTRWLRHDLRPMLERIFSEDRIRKEGLFSFPCVHTLMQEHFSGKRDNRKQLWTLLMFEQWKERYCP
jgi:asparagine synthase (glutamine-hydrolysing)